MRNWRPPRGRAQGGPASRRVGGGDGRAARDIAWALILVSLGACVATYVGRPLAVGVLLVAASGLFSWRRWTDALRVEEQLAWQSLHDPLTGLPDRSLVADRFALSVARTRRSARWIAVICLDIDRFGVLNETWGHDVGDEVLRRVATRLRAALRPTDTLARLGGDRFVAVCDDVPSVAHAEEITRRLADSFRDPFDIDGTTLVVTASAGVAVSQDPDAELNDLLREADAALSRDGVENDGALAVRIAHAGGTSQRALMERRLRAALDRNEFVLRYQPVCAASDGSIEGVEALLRWEDPEVGLVPPIEFVPLLEDSGLIIPVGAWVLDEACRQAAEWDRTLGRSLHIAVNVSPRQLTHMDFATRLEAILDEHTLDPSRLWLEITEAAFMNDASSAWTLLKRVKEMGVKLAADDFGTGYSSLSYVRRFALDQLKVDKSFVDGMVESAEDLAIVQSIIGIAQALKLQVVAEGVERPDQLRLLRDLGCDLVQGYLLHRPMTAADISTLLVPATATEVVGA